MKINVLTFDIYNFNFNFLIFLKLYIIITYFNFYMCLYHSYLSFFSLPLVCDAFLSHLLLSNVTAYIHGIVNALLSSPVFAYFFKIFYFFYL